MAGYKYRGKIGFISPAGDTGGCFERYALLPEGVVLIVTTLAVSRLVPEDFKKAFAMYPAAAEHLAAQECDVILVAGSLVFTHAGTDVSRDLYQTIRESVKVPVIINLETHLEALRLLSAKKIVIVTPYEEARTDERKKLCEQAGFEVVNTKSLGIQRRVEIQQLSPYTSYRMAMQAIHEAPEADAVYLSCPEWPTISIIEKFEQDTGKLVVSPVAAETRACLRAMGIHEITEGYGRLLRTV
ncbi:MAG: hypothetical protein HY695_05555 [Deltaproteobacteria bacterium]|nr:hypothetical protein [Deltaproteobacteria bacterium]